MVVGSNEQSLACGPIIGSSNSMMLHSAGSPCIGAACAYLCPLAQVEHERLPVKVLVGLRKHMQPLETKQGCTGGHPRRQRAASIASWTGLRMCVL